MTTDEAVSRLRQLDVRESFDRHGDGPWIVAYRFWDGDSKSGSLFSAFAPKRYRERALAHESWDLSIGSGLPAFMQSRSGGRWRAKYLRYGNDDGIEPLVIVQEHHGIKESPPQLCEEFRLYHNLWFDQRNSQMIHIADDGIESVAATIGPEEIRIRTNLLRQYQAARQLDLLLFVDSRLYLDFSLPDFDKGRGTILDEENSPQGTFFVVAADTMFDPRRTYSRYLGKRILPPPPRKDAGVWPYERSEDYFPEFIIGEDSAGRPIRHTCEEDKLGAHDRGAPHYLTPVFFRREVLQKYYEQPEKYAVEPGHLWCRRLWGLQIDNDHPDYVMVFLGDLGRDLPARERDYWLSFNIPPIGGMSESAFRRSFLAQPTGATSPDLQFKTLYRSFRDSWRGSAGWELYKDLQAADEHVFSRLRVPLVESQPEFESQILNLTKLLVDSLNERQLTSMLSSGVADEKGIDKFSRWLTQEGYPHVDRDIAHLRRLQRLRSRMVAHRKGSDYDRFIAAEIGEKSFADAVAELLVEACQMLVDIAAHFELIEAQRQ